MRLHVWDDLLDIYQSYSKEKRCDKDMQEIIEQE